MPPAIRHAHQGGSDRDHSHDTVANHDPAPGHHHHHHEGADHRHEHPDTTAPTVLGDYLVHLHWKLFGLDFCMPAPQQSEHDEDRGALRPALVRFVDELPTLIPGGGHWQGVPVVAAPAPGPRVVAVKTSPLHPPNLVVSIPLCDSARLERSGVLLV